MYVCMYVCTHTHITTHARSSESVSGCAVLVERGCGKFKDVARRYAELGAIAVIFVNSDDTVVSMNSRSDAVMTNESAVGIPVVMIARGTLDLRGGDMAGDWRVNLKPQVCAGIYAYVELFEVVCRHMSMYMHFW
jgi:hypothetical protein